jgi:tetratricopeptide (TPR) repeat protein
LEQHNRAGEQLLNDSLAEALVAYFDKHGDANERMRSRYMLGRTYYHLGELPRALETYLEAASCADTTSGNCDYKVLSRIHAQSAVIYHSQVQPRSQLKELGLAERYAWKAKDSLQAIECFSNQADAYDFLKMPDSVIFVCERSSALFEKIGRKDRASQMKGFAIISLIERKELGKSKQFIDDYEALSELFVQKDSIFPGHEIYYYMKGLYYAATQQLDSAEYLFRKELRDGIDLNNQIAGCKGLQKLYEKKKISDSIAKYASLSYELNDSAYNLSEMENIQKLQASYNYNHYKYLAEKKGFETKIAWLTSAIIIILTILLLWFFFHRYILFRRAALDYRLEHHDITRRFHEMAKSQPVQYPSLKDWQDLRSLVEDQIPSFKKTLIPDEQQPLNDMEYDVCVAIRVHLSPIEISKLKQCAPSYVTKIRKKLLLSIFDREGNGDDFDDEICKIR